MNAPLDTAALDAALALGCQQPGCTHQDHTGLYLNAACHKQAGVDVYYAGHGVLELRCHRCSRPVAVVAVAGSPAA